MKYPLMEEVAQADQFDLAKWIKLLPRPSTTEESRTLNVILWNFEGWTPELEKRIEEYENLNH